MKPNSDMGRLHRSAGVVGCVLAGGFGRGAKAATVCLRSAGVPVAAGEAGEERRNFPTAFVQPVQRGSFDLADGARRRRWWAQAGLAGEFGAREWKGMNWRRIVRAAVKSLRTARSFPGARLCARSTSRSRLAAGDAADFSGRLCDFGAAAAGPRRTQPRSLGGGSAARSGRRDAAGTRRRDACVTRGGARLRAFVPAVPSRGGLNSGFRK